MYHFPKSILRKVVQLLGEHIQIVERFHSKFISLDQKIPLELLVYWEEVKDISKLANFQICHVAE